MPPLGLGHLEGGGEGREGGREGRGEGGGGREGEGGGGREGEGGREREGGRREREVTGEGSIKNVNKQDSEEQTVAL